MAKLNRANRKKQLKQTLFKSSVLVSPVSLALMACGGGSNNSESISTHSGHAIKGPLQNATVFADLNRNGKLDADEPNTISSADGSFSFNTSESDFEIVVTTSKDTIDTSSGEIFDGLTLKAPKGADVISPLTTMVIETNLNKEEVADILGLGEINIFSFNPFSDGVDANEALKVEKAAHQTQLTLNAIATSGKEAGLSEENAKELAIQSMAVKLEKASSDGGKINLNNEDVLKDLVSIAETKITEKGGSKADFAKNSSVLINQVKNKNIEISNLDSLTSTEALSVFANTATISDTLATEIKSQTTSTIDVSDSTSSTSTDSASATSSSCGSTSTTTVTATTTTTPAPFGMCDCVSTTTAATATRRNSNHTRSLRNVCNYSHSSNGCDCDAAAAEAAQAAAEAAQAAAEAAASTTSSSVDTTTAVTPTVTDATADAAAAEAAQAAAEAAQAAAEAAASTTSSSVDTTTAVTPTVTVATAAAQLLDLDVEKIDSTWGTSGNDHINVGAFDDIVHTSGGNDTIILGSGGDTLIIEKATGHSVVRDFDINEDQLVLATGVFIKDVEIINDGFHLYTNFGGHVHFENIGDISTAII